MNIIRRIDTFVQSDKYKKANKYIMPCLALAEALFLTYIMYRVVHTNTDAVVAFGNIDRKVQLYGESLGILQSKSISEAVTKIAYRIHGIGIESSRMMSSVLFFPCFFMAELIVLKTEGKEVLNILGSCILVFCLFPTYHSNIFHFSAVFITLMFFFYIEQEIWKNGFGKNFIFFAIVFIALKYYGWDALLLAITIVFPIIVYSLLNAFHNDEKKKKMLEFSFAILLIGIVICTILRICGITDLFSNLYGAGGYTQWAPVKSIVNTGICMVADFIMYGFYLPYNGTMLSTLSVLYLARYMLVILSGIVLIRNSFYIFKDVSKIEKIDAIFTISVILNVLLLITMKSTLSSYSSIGYWPDLARYCAPSCFVMPILVVRYVVKNIERYTSESGELTIYVGIVGTLSMILLTVLMQYAVWDDVSWGYKDLSVEAANVLKSQYVEYYSEGIALGPYMFDGVTMNSDGAITATPVSNNYHYYIDYAPELYNNYRLMSFVVADASNINCYSLAEQQDYIGRYDMYSYDDLIGEPEKLLGSIFYFDHDVRWIPRVFNADELKDICEWKITCGTTRIKTKGYGLKEDSLLITVPEDITMETVVNENEVIYTIESHRNVSVGLECNCDTIDTIEIVPTYAAYRIAENVSIGKDEIEKLTAQVYKGEYYLSVWGNNIDAGEIVLEGDGNFKSDIIASGKGQKIYRIASDSGVCDFSIDISNQKEKSINIKGVALEASGDDLIIIKSQYQDNYLGWVTKDY